MKSFAIKIHMYKLYQLDNIIRSSSTVKTIKSILCAILVYDLILTYSSFFLGAGETSGAFSATGGVSIFSIKLFGRRPIAVNIIIVVNC